jgi:hypothetical protein
MIRDLAPYLGIEWTASRDGEIIVVIVALRELLAGRRNIIFVIR